MFISFESNSLLFILYFFTMPHISVVELFGLKGLAGLGERNQGVLALGSGRGDNQWPRCCPCGEALADVNMIALPSPLLLTKGFQAATPIKPELANDRNLFDIPCLGLRPTSQKSSAARVFI